MTLPHDETGEGEVDTGHQSGTNRRGCEQKRNCRVVHYATFLAGSRRIISTARQARPTTASRVAAWINPVAGTPSNIMLTNREAA